MTSYLPLLGIISTCILVLLFKVLFPHRFNRWFVGETRSKDTPNNGTSKEDQSKLPHSLPHVLADAEFNLIYLHDSLKSKLYVEPGNGLKLHDIVGEPDQLWDPPSEAGGPAPAPEHRILRIPVSDGTRTLRVSRLPNSIGSTLYCGWVKEREN